MADQRWIRLHLSLSGIVQGVGFRPFVFRLANELGLVGWVENNDTGVGIEVEGPHDTIETFVERLQAEAPALAAIETIERRQIGLADDAGFTVAASRTAGSATALVSPDVATCDDCLRELADEADRRFGYPFTNCTNCGPRYSIVTDIPYDRPNTTMSGFGLCGPCRAEYGDPGNRRFHAQPVCCPRCGPRLSESIGDVVSALRRGEIVAVKGLGGYHLTAVAADEHAVAGLRARKHREDKPFAVMVPEMEVAQALCDLGPAERRLLASPQRPIVLARRRPGAPVAEAVAPRTTELGLLLPYTPLHHLLLGELGEPMVCTSGNLSDEPIAYRDAEARERLATVADRFLGHDRPIHIRVDDSVARVIDEQPYLIRRSRGYAPAPITVAGDAPRTILAVGAELKNTIAFARGHHVFVSHHIGDLKSLATHSAFVEAIDHLQKLFELQPEIVASDLHPDYRSSAYADERADLAPVRVQHHHAHVAACLADAGHAGPVIGVAFDGIGYGDDGTIWGGEFLLADASGYERRGWFDPVPMPGGDAATRHPWRMAASYLDRAGAAETGPLAVAERHDRWGAVLQVARSPANAPATSSVGRLFDAVSALLGVCDSVNYEGQAAIELEQVADEGADGSYRAAIASSQGAHVVRGVDLVTAALDDLRRGEPISTISIRFHRGLADTVARVCELIRAESGVSAVALSGGVFLNRILLLDSMARLGAAGFDVLRHRQVPCNDGGISFGQAVVAAARDRAGLVT